SPPIRVVSQPGQEASYSGGGFEVAQQAILDVTQAPFDVDMRRLVFDPLHLDRMMFAVELPTAMAANAARAHGGDGTPLPGGWHLYPEQAAAALWTTPSALARVVLAVMAAKRGERSDFLRADLANQLVPDREGPGLGFFVSGHGDSTFFLHDGAVEGA